MICTFVFIDPIERVLTAKKCPTTSAIKVTKIVVLFLFFLSSTDYLRWLMAGGLFIVVLSMNVWSNKPEIKYTQVARMVATSGAFRFLRS